ncbi:unnamed protein product [Microthlaspi erraticum]|uniref:Uncharacterized protein n=1 Tax=Microthlaspi erraticum TaxID=1685480 RepID=A0A6D2J388_9BRAS|nr:unnamed protein product [Microthlaspi erraticum]
MQREKLHMREIERLQTMQGEKLDMRCAKKRLGLKNWLLVLLMRRRTTIMTTNELLLVHQIQMVKKKKFRAVLMIGGEEEVGKSRLDKFFESIK